MLIKLTDYCRQHGLNYQRMQRFCMHGYIPCAQHVPHKSRPYWMIDDQYVLDVPEHRGTKHGEPIPPGTRFGKLTVISAPIYERSGRTKYSCKCDCGNITIVTGENLKSGQTKSCGCGKRGWKKGTATHTDRSIHVPTSTIAGVSWDKKREKWVAQITVDNKRINLGQYENIDDAIIARRAAEEKYNMDQPPVLSEIKQLRLKYGLTRRQLSEMYDIPYSSLTGWENGYTKAPKYAAKLISIALEKQKNSPEA